MLIPLSTDAPIYHFPFVCIGLIVVNTIVHVATGFGFPDAVDQWGPYALEYGNGLQPMQWVTSNFIHMGPVQLVGNMIFLWGFGLVVEGKLGWWRFLLLYLAIGIVQCAVEQTLMLAYDGEAAAQSAFEENAFLADGLDAEIEEAAQEYRNELKQTDMPADQIDAAVEEFKEEERAAIVEIYSDIVVEQFPGSAGTSAIIYGLLAICLVWAPKNEVNVLVMIFYRGITFETSIMAFSCWYIGLEFFTVTLGGFGALSSLLHAMGAVTGFGAGVLLFKLKMVDCEDWDLFAVMSGHYGPWARDRYGNPIERDKDWKLKPDTAAAPKKKKRKSIRSGAAIEQKVEQIAELVEAGDFEGANDELYNLRLRDPKALPDEESLKALAIGLAKKKDWDSAIPLMEDCIAGYPETADPIRLRLANIQLTVNADVRAAARLLKAVDREGLTEKQLSTWKRLRDAIKSMK